jgi:hypothetical protein
MLRRQSAAEGNHASAQSFVAHFGQILVTIESAGEDNDLQLKELYEPLFRTP